MDPTPPPQVPEPLVLRHREAHLEERPAVVQEAHAGGRPRHQGQRALRRQTALLQTLRGDVGFPPHRPITGPATAGGAGCEADYIVIVSVLPKVQARSFFSFFFSSLLWDLPTSSPITVTGERLKGFCASVFIQPLFFLSVLFCLLSGLALGVNHAGASPGIIYLLSFVLFERGFEMNS